ncbi:MAG: NAD(P)-binding protein [Endomicrobiia bacterium]
MEKIIILGAGLTGLTTGYELERKKVNYLILEKEPKVGGLCKSININNFIFDYTGHFLHFSDKKTENFVKRILKGNIIKIKRDARILTKYAFKKNFLIPYPLQANIKFLRSDIKLKSVKNLLFSYLNKTSNSISNFYDWLIYNFGKTLTDIFFCPYNEKLWKTPLKKISISWVRQFVPLPEIDYIILSCITGISKEYGYNTFFYYPKYNGIQSLIDAIYSLVDKNKVITSVDLIKVDYRKKEVNFIKEGKLHKTKYDYLISTIPLTELIKLSNFPQNIKNLSSGLKYSGVICYNIALSSLDIKKVHWIYFPDEEIVFYRVGFYNNINKNLIPNSRYASMYVEISVRDTKDFDEFSIYERVINNLIKTGILNSSKQIMFYNLLKIPVGYVIYDHYREKNLPFIHKFLNNNKIYSIGRYGGWKYSYMSENIAEAINTVKSILYEK